MRYQLRTYTITCGAMDEWLSEWQGRVRPLRQRFGFQVVGAWVDRDHDRFVWILGHEDFEANDERYYASSERKALDPDPARHIVSAETFLMTSVL